LKDRDCENRRRAIVAIRDIRPRAKEAVPDLIQALRATSTREVAAQALGAIGSDAKDAVPALIKVVKRRLTGYKSAVDALGAIGPDAKQAVPTLIQALRSRRLAKPCYADDLSPAALLINRASMGTLAPACIARGDFEYSEHLISALGRIGPSATDAVPLLVEEVVRNHSNWRGWLAARALGRIGSSNYDAKGISIKEVQRALVIMMRDLSIHPEERANAALALGEICSTSTSFLYPVALEKAAHKDDSMIVRKAAQEALEQISRTYSCALEHESV
jgi:hypothetical protein